MKPIRIDSLSQFPTDFHGRIVQDIQGKYWLSCYLRSDLNKGETDVIHPMDPLVVMEEYSVHGSGVIIYELG